MGFRKSYLGKSFNIPQQPEGIKMGYTAEILQQFILKIIRK